MGCFHMMPMLNMLIQMDMPSYTWLAKILDLLLTHHAMVTEDDTEFLSSHLCSPNEDFGRLNKALRVCF